MDSVILIDTTICLLLKNKQADWQRFWQTANIEDNILNTVQIGTSFRYFFDLWMTNNVCKTIVNTFLLHKAHEIITFSAACWLWLMNFLLQEMELQICETPILGPQKERDHCYYTLSIYFFITCIPCRIIIIGFWKIIRLSIYGGFSLCMMVVQLIILVEKHLVNIHHDVPI